ncbi:hypothetical protein ACHAXS_002150 [Conticribra weissflogii]
MKRKSKLSIEERIQFVDLKKVHDNLATNQDSAVKQTNTIKNQLDIYQSKRKKEKFSFNHWFEKIFKEFEVKRASYHGGQITGGHIIKKTKFANDIFRKSCCILKEDGMKKLGVMDETITALSNRTVKLLKAWDRVFRILMKQAPSEEIKEEAQEK